MIELRYLTFSISLLRRIVFPTVLLWVSLGLIAVAWALPLDFSGPTPNLGAMDRDGTLLVVSDIREADFGGGLRLPMRFVYRSADRSLSPYGWTGFHLTALESRALPTTDHLYLVSMPGGNIEYFRAEMVDGAVVWQNNDNSWVGTEGSGWGNFTMTRWDGWQIEFRGSFIYKLKTDTGRVLHWSYDTANPGLATRISEVGNSKEVRLVLSDDEEVMGGSSVSRGAGQLIVNEETYTFSYINGTLKEVGYPDGRKKQWLFEAFADETSRLTLTEPGGWWRSWVYHTQARSVLSDDHWDYTVAAAVVDEDGLVYDRPDQKRTRIATGEYETWHYTAANSIHTVRDVLGNKRVSYRYKSTGPLYNRVYKIERQRAGESDFTTVWRGSYDAASGDLLRSYDAQENETVFTTERFSGASEFQPPKKVTITDPLGRERSLERDLQGDVIEVVDAAGVKRKLEYDSRHRLTRVKNAENGVLVRIVYGDEDQVLELYDASENKTTFEYDLHLGEALLKKATTPEGRVSALTRDAKGRITRLQRPSSAAWEFTHVDNWEVIESVRDPLDQETTYAYDARLNRIQTTDPLSRITTAFYDDLDLPAEVTNALNHATTLENNANGDMVKLTDARSKEYTQTWESAGSRRTLGWPDSAAETSTFDANGNLAQWKSRGDFATVNVARNAAQEVSGLTWSADAGSGNTTFTRNAGGQITGASSATMGLSVEQSMSYDAEGRLASLGQTVGYVTRTANLTYDLEGRVSTLAYPAGFTISYHYNKDGQIEAIRQGNATLSSYGYDAGGRLATRTLSNGVVTSYTYDAVERLDSITVSLGGATLWAERYGYNAAGERIRTLRGITGTLGDAYWLDAASQLRGVKYGAADATGAYSGINATTTTEWSYDAVGNRLEETSGAGTANYTVNTINQYTAITGVGALAYSARGDLTQLGDWELTYDALGNLIRAHNTATNALAQYWRDATGHRAVKDVDGSKTLFFNLGTAQLETYDLTANTTSSTIYEPGIDRPLAEISDSGDVTFYHQDWLGSVVLLTNTLGTKVQSYTYDAWGQPSGFDASGVGIPPASFVSRFLYTGREYDTETALYHYRARAYSPALGRFLQPDPIDFSGGDGNLFRYVGNNPVQWVDPLGLIINIYGPQEFVDSIQDSIDDIADSDPILKNIIDDLRKSNRVHDIYPACSSKNRYPDQSNTRGKKRKTSSGGSDIFIKKPNPEILAHELMHALDYDLGSEKFNPGKNKLERMRWREKRAVSVQNVYRSTKGLKPLKSYMTPSGVILWQE